MIPETNSQMTKSWNRAGGIPIGFGAHGAPPRHDDEA